VRVIDSDLATVTAEADKVLLVQEPQPWILHLELQAGTDQWLSERVAWYNALLSYKHKCPVHSLLVLLTRRADSPKLTGELVDRIGDEPPYRVFRYQVVRVWELDAEKLATGGLGLMPLAPLADGAEPNLPGLMALIGHRLAREMPDRAEAKTMGTIMELVLGLRYDREMIDLMMEKIMSNIDWTESVGYQMILEEGAIKALRETILRMGKKKFGKPSAKTVREVKAIADESRLTELSERILDVDSWKKLLTEQP
jgi:hypothetical protein